MKIQEAAIEAGLSLDEAGCLDLTVDLSNRLLSLPELHSSDRQEICQLIHALQEKILYRPTYRKYLKAAE